MKTPIHVLDSQVVPLALTTLSVCDFVYCWNYSGLHMKLIHSAPDPFGLVGPLRSGKECDIAIGGGHFFYMS